MRQFSTAFVWGMLAMLISAPSWAQLPFFEGFEGAAIATYTTSQNPIPALTGPNHSWAYQAVNTESRMRTGATFGFRTGSRGITLDDAVSNTVSSTNYLTLTLNLAAYQGAMDIRLSYWLRSHGNETTWPENKVWVRGSNTEAWLQASDHFIPLPTNGVWTNRIVDVDSLLYANGQAFTATFQVRFGQQDDQQATSTTGLDGFSFDDIEITGTVPVADDAGIAGVISPVQPIVAGVQNIDLSLRNFGNNTLNNVTINWTANGLPQVPANYTGPALSPFTAGSATVGTFNFVPRPTVFRFWTSQPNGNADNRPANDTFQTTLCAALSGTYTVGTPTSDYATMAEAVQALTVCGVNGPVVFQVQPGTYVGHIALPPIVGASATNTITFDGGNQAILTHAGGTGVGNATFLLNGADFVTIQNFTIRNTGTAPAWGIQLTNQANYNRILNNRIEMPLATNDLIPIVASASVTDDFAEGDNANYTLIQGNILSGGQMSIHMEGAANPNLNRGNRILNNIMSRADDQAIYLDKQDSIEIIGNRISDMRDAFAGDGIYTFQLMNYIIERNEVSANRYGIYISSGNALVTPNRRGRIVNNMVRCSINSAIYLLTVNNSDIYHNTALAGTNNPAFYLSGFTQLNIKNNIFYATNSWAFRVINNTAMQSLDYNVYHTETGTNLINYGGINYVDLAAWQAATFAHDANSHQGNPIFRSGTDLHLEGLLANDRGDNTVGVSTDIDGDNRPAGTSVDIGADEYTPVFVDAGVTAMVQPTPPLSSGFAAVTVRVRNFGNDTLRSFNIQWSINGLVLGTHVYSGAPLPPFTSTDVALGSLNFPNNPANVLFYTNQPNGQADQRNSNDTLRITTCIALSGTYTVGTPTANFPTLNAAVEALQSCGVSGPVVMQVQPGTYAQQLVILPVPGASASNTVTFDGANQAILVHDAGGFRGNATVLLDGADHIRIRNFTIRNTGTTIARGVQLINRADSNEITGNRIEVFYTANVINVVGISISNSYTSNFAEGNNANGTLIENNIITGGEIGIHIEAAFGAPNKRNRIIGNTISNVDDYGIYTDDQDSLEIINNRIFDVRNNLGDGITCFDTRDFIIMGNNVLTPDWSLYMSNNNQGAYVPARRGLIANNMLRSLNSYAGYFLSCEETNIYHNTFFGQTHGFYLTNPVDLDIRNNIFMANGVHAFWCTSAVNVGTMNYNLYFVPPTATAMLRFGTTNYTTLAAWQAAPGGFDQNSVFGDPIFFSNTDLHVRGTAANNVGDNSVGLTTDIDGQARPFGGATTVDIGADEFDPISNDLSPLAFLLPRNFTCGTATDTIRVIIRNMGSATVTAATLSTQVTGSATANFTTNYTGNLAAQQQDTITIGTINTTNGGVFNIRLISQLAGDQYPINDTLMRSFSIRPAGALVGVDDTTCVGFPAQLTVQAAADLQLNWFTVPTGGSPVGQGLVFTTPALAANTTYYVQPAAFVADSLTTTFATNNSCGGGNMFNITANSTIVINRLAVNPVAATTVNVYFIPNSTYVGNQNNPAAWTLLGSVPNISTTAPFNLPANLTIPAGSTYAIYVEYNSRYTNGNLTYSNADMTITTGMGHCSSFSTGIADRMFNGTIYYNKGGAACDTSRVAVNAVVTPAPSISLGADTSICADGGLATFSAQNLGGNYLWNTGATTQSIQANQQGLYAVSVTNQYGCEVKDTVSLTYLPTPLLQLTGGSVNCFGQTINLSPSISGGTGVFTFAWSNGATTQNLSGVGAGNYNLTISDNNNCTYNLSTTVTEPSLLDAGNIGIVPIACTGGPTGGLDIFPNGGTPAYSFLWSNGATTPAITGLVEGTYSVTVTDANGCVDTVSTYLPPVNPVSITLDSLTDEFTQLGGAIDISITGGTAPYQIRWNTGQTSEDLTNLAAATYTVTVEDANGCTSTRTFTVNYTVPVLALEELSLLSSIHLFPNPTKGNSQLVFSLKEAAEAQVTVLDVLGRVVQQTAPVMVQERQQQSLQLEHLPSGLYLIQLRLNNQQTTLKLIKE